MIKTLRLMLHIGRAAPLSKSLRPAAAPWDRTAANVFWPADADPANGMPPFRFMLRAPALTRTHRSD